MQPPVTTINRLPYFHVIRRGTQWSVHREGEAGRAHLHPSREQALEAAQLLAERYSCIVVEHDGKWLRRHDYRAAGAAPVPVLARGTASYPVHEAEQSQPILARGTGDFPIVSIDDEGPDPRALN